MLFRIIEKLVFVICLIIQGLYVKLRIVKLPEAPGERKGHIIREDSPSISVLIIGDSAAAGVGAEHQEEALSGNLAKILGEHYDLTWVLMAKSGETTKTKLHKLQTINENYNYIVVSLGVNDITTPMLQSTWIKQQENLIAMLKNNCHPRKIIMGSLPPIHEFFALPNPLRYLLARRALRFTAGLKALTNNLDGVELLDLPALNGEELSMATDGFHPGPTIYKAWANSLAEVIQSDQIATSTDI